MTPALTDKRLRCVAIDDEPLALNVIRTFCQRLDPPAELLTFSDPEAGLSVILRESPDIVFLDIEMENISGLTLAGQLPAGTCFIFTTAYLDYALEGFNLDAVDYLHKPFSFDRFRTAVAKALRRLSLSDNAAQKPSSITVKQEYSNVTIPLDEILYIEAMEGYCKIFRENAPCVLSRVLLKNLASMLPDTEFLRIHRSFIVPRSKISSFTRQTVTLRPCARFPSAVTLPVGRQYAPALRP